MVASHLQSVAMSQFNILCVFIIDSVTTLSSLQIDVLHFRVIADCLPEHLSLVMTEVDAMNMRTGILAQNIAFLCADAC